MAAITVVPITATQDQQDGVVLAAELLGVRLEASPAEADAVLVVGDGGDATLSQVVSRVRATSPRLVLRLSEGRDPRWPASAIPGYLQRWSLPVGAESFGCPFIVQLHLVCFSVVPCSPPVVTHGPAAAAGPDGRPVLWDASAFDGVGLPVSSEDNESFRKVCSAISGVGALPIQPGFASVLPRSPVQVLAEDGSVQYGAIFFARHTHVYVIRAAEVRLLMGYPPRAQATVDPREAWRAETRLVPIHLLVAVLKKAADVAGSIPRT